MKLTKWQNFKIWMNSYGLMILATVGIAMLIVLVCYILGQLIMLTIVFLLDVVFLPVYDELGYWGVMGLITLFFWIVYVLGNIGKK